LLLSKSPPLQNYYISLITLPPNSSTFTISLAPLAPAPSAIISILEDIKL
jgi:hypothetical protein